MNTLISGETTLPYYREMFDVPLGEDDLGPRVPVERLDEIELGFLEAELDSEVAAAEHAVAVLRERISRRRNRIALERTIDRLWQRLHEPEGQRA